MLRHMLQGGVHLLELYRIPGVRQQVVADIYHCGAGSDGKLTNEPVVSIDVARNPSAAMAIQHNRQSIVDVIRPDNTNRHRAGGAYRESQVLDLGAGPADGQRLEPPERDAGLGWWEEVERRITNERIDELLGSQIESGQSCRIGQFKKSIMISPEPT
jgi:hypothetical protein